MNRAAQLWLFTITLTFLAVIIVIALTMLSIAYMPELFSLIATIVVGLALAAGIATLVRRLLRN